MMMYRNKSCLLFGLITMVALFSTSSTIAAAAAAAPPEDVDVVVVAKRHSKSNKKTKQPTRAPVVQPWLCFIPPCMRDNVIYFFGKNGHQIDSRLLNSCFVSHVTEGQPFGGSTSTSDGKIHIEAGDKRSDPVKDAFNKELDNSDAFLFQDDVVDVPDSDYIKMMGMKGKAWSMNWYIYSIFQIDGIGEIYLYLGQVGDRSYSIKGEGCTFSNEPNDSYKYHCKTTDGKSVTFSYAKWHSTGLSGIQVYLS